MFLLVWLGAVAVWKFGRIEQKWSAPLPVADEVTDQ
jgi:high-affinity nickel-transport protein